MLLPILQATDLSKSYPDSPRLFSGLSFELETGLLAVTGRNGSGKTTLLKILASLARPASGRVRVLRDGRDLPMTDRRLAVGWAGPDLAFYEDLTALENLSFFRQAAGWNAGTQELRVRLKNVGLEEAADRRVATFSTGMKQRLRLAFALLFDPPFLLLDEPMAGLDAAGRATVERIVAEKRRTSGVVLASNDAGDFPSPNQTIELSKA